MEGRQVRDGDGLRELQLEPSRVLVLLHVVIPAQGDLGDGRVQVILTAPDAPAVGVEVCAHVNGALVALQRDQALIVIKVGHRVGSRPAQCRIAHI